MLARAADRELTDEDRMRLELPRHALHASLSTPARRHGRRARPWSARYRRTSPRSGSLGREPPRAQSLQSTIGGVRSTLRSSVRASGIRGPRVAAVCAGCPAFGTAISCDRGVRMHRARIEGRSPRRGRPRGRSQRCTRPAPPMTVDARVNVEIRASAVRADGTDTRRDRARSSSSLQEVATRQEEIVRGTPGP